jgi:hypothetical protein
MTIERLVVEIGRQVVVDGSDEGGAERRGFESRVSIDAS